MTTTSDQFVIDGYRLDLRDILVFAVPAQGTFKDWQYPPPGTFCVAQFSAPRSQTGIDRIHLWVEGRNVVAGEDGFHLGYSSANWWLLESENPIGKARYWEGYCQYYSYRLVQNLKPKWTMADIGL